MELNDEEIPPLIDVIDTFHNGAREHEQQLFEAGIQFSAWNSGGDVLNLHTRELSVQRMIAIRFATSREMSTMKIPPHVATHVPQQTELQAATQETVESIEVIEEETHKQRAVMEEEEKRRA